MRIYKENEHPTVVDNDIMKHLTVRQQHLIDVTDSFLFYREDGYEGVDIILGTWECDEAFSTIEELKNFLDECIDETDAIISEELKGICTEISKREA